MVSNPIRPNFCLFCNICSNNVFVTLLMDWGIESTLSETSINSIWSIRRGEMMQQETIIKLIKQSIQNFEETNNMEHLNDIIQIIFEYKKASNGTC